MNLIEFIKENWKELSAVIIMMIAYLLAITFRDALPALLALFLVPAWLYDELNELGVA